MSQKIVAITLISYLYIFCDAFLMSIPINKCMEEYVTPDAVVAQFINEMNAYGGDGEYNPDNQYSVEDDILNSPDANVTNDIPGIEKEECVAGDYLLDLKEYKVRVSYDEKFRIASCNFKGQRTLGAVLNKTVQLPDGHKRQHKEFLEIKQSGTSFRIVSISSNLFQKSFQQVDCQRIGTTEPTTKKKSCQVLILANQAYQKGNYAEALHYYTKAKDCETVDIMFIERRIKNLNTRNRLVTYLQEADIHYTKKEYDKALQLYRILLDSEQITFFNKSEIGVKANLCTANINYQNAIQKADFFFKQNLFTKALPHYETALRWKANDEKARNRIIVCQEKINQNYQEKIKREIATAAREMSRGKKVVDNAIILMKYEKSGYLTGKQYFYLAQITDNQEKKFKKAFSLSNSNFCVLSRRFALKAIELGYESDQFEDFWEIHFNAKSRVCR